jgi:hypothetical protein
VYAFKTGTFRLDGDGQSPEKGRVEIMPAAVFAPNEIGYNGGTQQS